MVLSIFLLPSHVILNQTLFCFTLQFLFLFSVHVFILWERCVCGGGGYLKSTMSFVRVRSSVGEVLKSHFIHSLEPHPRWSF